jgi:hypothetical protein
MKPALTVALLLALVLPAESSESLRATFETLQPKLASSAFGRPLVLESSEEGDKVRGDVFAVVNNSFRDVATGLDTPGKWCEVLILHLNVKSCGVSPTNKGSSLQLILGRKQASGVDDGQRLVFRFRVVESSADRFQVAMQADDGPLGTEDYELRLEATPKGAEQSFLHLAYAYTFSTTARLAMSTYLGTLGRGKVGFTVTSHAANGEPVYVGGVRGTLERNTMRYYLAIEIVLASVAMPLSERRQWRLNSWFDATEKYGRQLHELTKSEYLAGKE